MVGIEELLQIMVQRGGSDLHITAGSQPKIRIDGSLISTEHEVLTPNATKKIVYSVLTEEQIARFEKDLELDISFGIEAGDNRSVSQPLSRVFHIEHRRPQDCSGDDAQVQDDRRRGGDSAAMAASTTTASTTS